MAKKDKVEKATEEVAAEKVVKTPDEKVTPIHEAQAAYIKETTGYDVAAVDVFLVNSTRARFRKTSELYAGAKGSLAERREQEAEAKAEAAEAREKAREEKLAAAEEAKAEKAKAREEAKAEKEAEKAEAKAAREAEKKAAAAEPKAAPKKAAPKKAAAPAKGSKAKGKKSDAPF